MKIAFLELDPNEREFFRKKFLREELSFPESLSEVAEDAEIVSVFIGSHIDEAFLQAHPALRLVDTRSGTHDHIDMEGCARRGVEVRCVESYGDHVVAEHVFALLLALTRRLREAMVLKEGTFYYETLRGTELRGKTFGILGAGRIGLEAAALAGAFGMKVLAHDVHPAPWRAGGISYVSFHELLRRSHVLSLHLPLNGNTFQILNRETLAKCRKGVLIVNTARGQLIDTAALLEALKEGTVGGAGLDVIGEEAAMRRAAPRIVRDQILDRLHGDAPHNGAERTRQIESLMLVGRLLELPNVVFTPHTAFNCTESIRRIHEATVKNIRDFIQEGGEPAAAKPARRTRAKSARY